MFSVITHFDLTHTDTILTPSSIYSRWWLFLLLCEFIFVSVRVALITKRRGSCPSPMRPKRREPVVYRWHKRHLMPFHGHISFTVGNKQRFLTPGHQGWNDLHSLCRIGMEYYLLNNDDNNIIYWIMMRLMIMMTMIIIMIIMMTMMIIGTATIMVMIIIITTTLTMTIMKMIMIKTAQTPCQSLYKDRRI